MTELTTKNAVRGFADAVNRASYAGERIVLTRRGKRVAALVPLADLAHLEQAAGSLRTSANPEPPPTAPLTRAPSLTEV